MGPLGLGRRLAGSASGRPVSASTASADGAGRTAAAEPPPRGIPPGGAGADGATAGAPPASGPGAGVAAPSGGETGAAGAGEVAAAGDPESGSAADGPRRCAEPAGRSSSGSRPDGGAPPVRCAAGPRGRWASARGPRRLRPGGSLSRVSRAEAAGARSGGPGRGGSLSRAPPQRRAPVRRPRPGRMAQRARPASAAARQIRPTVAARRRRAAAVGADLRSSSKSADRLHRPSWAPRRTPASSAGWPAAASPGLDAGRRLSRRLGCRPSLRTAASPRAHAGSGRGTVAGLSRCRVGRWLVDASGGLILRLIVLAKQLVARALPRVQTAGALAHDRGRRMPSGPGRVRPCGPLPSC